MVGSWEGKLATEQSACEEGRRGRWPAMHHRRCSGEWGAQGPRGSSMWGGGST